MGGGKGCREGLPLCEGSGECSVPVIYPSEILMFFPIEWKGCVLPVDV